MQVQPLEYLLKLTQIEQILFGFSKSDVFHACSMHVQLLWYPIRVGRGHWTHYEVSMRHGI